MESLRAVIKDGRAITVINPMIEATIVTSKSVKPEVLDFPDLVRIPICSPRNHVFNILTVSSDLDMSVPYLYAENMPIVADAPPCIVILFRVRIILKIALTFSILRRIFEE